MSTDVLSLMEAKQAISLEDNYSDNDSLLSAYISSVSARLDQACGPIVQRSVTGELYDGGYSTIWVRQKPLVSVSSVIEYQKTNAVTLTEDTNLTSPSEGFRLNLKAGTMTRTKSGLPYYFYDGLQNIKITYISGRYADTESVGDIFKVAAQAFLAHLWKTNQGLGTSTFGAYDGGTPNVTYSLPNRVKDLLGDELIQPGIG